MTVGEVAERAGVAKGTVYLYFDTKDELVAGLQLATRPRSWMPPACWSTGRNHISPVWKRSCGRWWTCMCRARAPPPRPVPRNGDANDATLHGLRRVASLVHRGRVAARSFTVDDPAFASEFLLHGLHGVLIAFVHHPRGSSRDLCGHVSKAAPTPARHGLTPTLSRSTKGWGQKTGRVKPRHGEGGAGRSWCSGLAWLPPSRSSRRSCSRATTTA